MAYSKADKAFLCYVLLFQIFFLVSIFAFYDLILPGDHPFFRVTSREYWDWLVADYSSPYSAETVALFEVVLRVSESVFLVAAVMEWYPPLKRLCAGLRDRRPCKGALLWLAALLAVCLLWCLLYLPFFYYFKFTAEHYRLYMRVARTELVALIAISLLFLNRRFASAQGG